MFFEVIPILVLSSLYITTGFRITIHWGSRDVRFQPDPVPTMWHRWQPFVLFHRWVVSHCVYRLTTSPYSLIRGRTLGCSCFLATVNSVLQARWGCRCPGWFHFPAAALMVVLLLVSWRTYILFPMMAILIYALTNHSESSLFFTSLSTFVIFYLFCNCQITWNGVIFQHSFDVTVLSLTNLQNIQTS